MFQIDGAPAGCTGTAFRSKRQFGFQHLPSSFRPSHGEAQYFGFRIEGELEAHERTAQAFVQDESPNVGKRGYRKPQLVAVL